MIPSKADSESSLLDLLDLPDLEEFLIMKNLIWKKNENKMRLENWDAGQFTMTKINGETGGCNENKSLSIWIVFSEEEGGDYFQ